MSTQISNGVGKIISLFLPVLFTFPFLASAHSEGGCSNVVGGWGGMMGGWGNMMGWGGMSGGAWGWLGIFTYLVWLGISVLVLIWLYRKVFGKNKNK